MDLTIRDAFVDGIYEAFSILFTEDIQYRGLDLSYAPNVYDEDKYKQYLSPVSLVGSVKRAIDPLADKSNATDTDIITFVIPKKSLDLADISVEDIEYIKKGLFVYKKESYRAVNIEYGTLVQDTYLIYRFFCVKE